MTHSDVVVVGAGLAGLTAARDLARAGLSVCLLEARRHPGGATFSLDSPFGRTDNSLHLFLGCYRECLHLLEELGTTEGLDTQPDRYPIHRAGRRGTLVLRPALGALAFPIGLLNASGWNWSDRLSLLKAGIRLQLSDPAEGETVGQLLNRLGLHSPVALEFWREWALSVFNGPLEPLDARLFHSALRTMFASAQAARPLLTRWPLERLLIGPLSQELERAGGQIRLGAAVRTIKRQPAGGFLLEGESGSVSTDRLVWAAAPEALALAWQAESLPGLPQSTAAAGIANLHLPVKTWPWRERLLGLFGERFQFLFRPPVDGGAEERSVILVASGLGQLEGRVLEQEGRELLTRLGLVCEGRGWLIRQPRALPLQTPEWNRLRPLPGELLPGLWVCGAWCRTGLPLTMESAVLSARQMARPMVAQGPRSPIPAC